MSLTALPVRATDIAALEQGVQFFQTSAAHRAAVAASINTQGSGQSVFTDAASLINSQLALAQVAMADSALMEGATVQVGTSTTPNSLAAFALSFLPTQVKVAIANGFSQTVYAAEALGLALGGNAAFDANFITPFTHFDGPEAGFAGAASYVTGTNFGAVLGFVQNWTKFYTANPSATHGLTVTQAAYGAAFGDAVGAALRAPASLNLPLTTVFSTTNNNGFSPNTVKGLVANALIDNAEGLYKPGVELSALPAHTPLQGEFHGPNPPAAVVGIADHVNSHMV